jgi:hypothetical protein
MSAAADGGGCDREPPRLKSEREATLMQDLVDEIVRRFPEVAPQVDPDDGRLPYLMVNYVVEWLLTVAKPALDPEVVERVLDFDRWCMSQPRGQSADDDIWTVAVVALREKLFFYDELLPLVPRLMPREELLENRDYLIQWVGRERYEAALRLSGGVA